MKIFVLDCVNWGRRHNIKIDNSSFERMEQLKYMATTLTDQNSILEEMKSRLKPGNACYRSVQNILFSSLLSKNLKIMIHRTIILPVVYGYETWSLTLKEESRLNVFESRVLRRIFGPKRDEITSEWRKLPNEELNDLYSSPNIFRASNQEEWEGRGVLHVWGRGEVHTGFLWGNLRERDHLEELGVDRRIIFR